MLHSSYLISSKGFDVHFWLELGHRNNLGPDLESEGHHGVHGVDMEKGKHGKSRFLQGI